jgi:hypothetical protein
MCACESELRVSPLRRQSAPPSVEMTNSSGTKESNGKGKSFNAKGAKFAKVRHECCESPDGWCGLFGVLEVGGADGFHDFVFGDVSGVDDDADAGVGGDGDGSVGV